MKKLLFSFILLLLTCGLAYAVGGIVGSPISGGTSTTLSTGAVTTTEILDGTIEGWDVGFSVTIGPHSGIGR